MSAVDNIAKRGQNIVIFGDLWPDGLLCIKSATNGWMPTSRDASPSNNPGGGNGEQSPVPSGQIGEMIQLWYDNANKWNYGQGEGRLDPPSSGYSDCSGCIWWAINKINPDAAKNVGQWTGAMVTSGTEIARGTRNTPFPVDKSKAGDILLIEWNYTNWQFNDVSSHVEWVVGEDHLWGAGSGPLPHDSGKASQYCRASNLGCWMLRRILAEE